MDPDLERLIRLQHIDTFTEQARRRIADHPALVAGLDRQLEAAQGALAAAKQAADQGQVARRTLEKDVAAIQSRLTKYKDQLMEVKTNKEYQAMQKEIEVAQKEVARLEDRLLEQLLANDELAAAVKAAEARLSSDKTAVEAERARLGQETGALEQELAAKTAARKEVVGQLPPGLLATYDTIARGRRGQALALARGGLCTACHVRIRPQVYNEILANDAIHQCDSCQRILYFAQDNPTDAEAETSR